MFIAGRPVVGNSPFLQGWQQEYMKAHGSIPPKEKVFEFLLSVVNNNGIPMQNKQAEIRMLDQMQKFDPAIK